MATLLGLELVELNGPVSAGVSGELLEISAGAGTDLFCAPDRSNPTLNAPALLIDVRAGDFTLSARVESTLRETYDAGALILWRDPEHWAKFAVELSPQNRATIVSVVTRTLSDDCNSIAPERPDAQLRIARIDDAFAFHVKVGEDWSLIRHFTLGGGPVRPGFLAQSPTGHGCKARFTEIVHDARRLGDLRDGT